MHLEGEYIEIYIGAPFIFISRRVGTTLVEGRGTGGLLIIFKIMGRRGRITSREHVPFHAKSILIPLTHINIV